MKKIGLIGRNISYSFSRSYFADKFQKEHIQQFEYVNFDIQNIEQVTDVLNNQEHLGFNVTIPYKETIITHLDSLDSHATAIGAVNTVKKIEDKLIGYNTDWIGFLESIKHLIKPNVKNALVLGTGGASKAVNYALNQLNISCTIVSRTKTEHTLSYQELTQEIVASHSIIINTTPLGTYPNTDQYPEIPYEFINHNHIAIDLIYNPVQTEFLRKCSANGAKIQNGYQMLVNQAEESWRIWNIL